MNHDRLHSLASAFVRLLIGTAIGALAIAAAAILAFRVWGIPDPWQKRLLEELDRRGVHIDYGKLYFDTGGRLIIRDAVWKSALSNADTTVRAARIRCGIAWWSWWRRQPFLHSIDLQGGRVETRLDDSTAATLRDLRCSASLGVDEFILESMSARILNVSIEGSGRIPWDAFRRTRAPGIPSKPLDLSGLAPAWRRAEEISAEIRSPRPPKLTATFKGSDDIGQFFAEVRILFPPLTYRGISVREARGSATFQSDVARIPRLEIHLDPGASITLACRADLQQKQGSAVIEVSGDPSWALPLLPESAKKTVSSLRFDAPPSTRCEVRASWDGTPSATALLDADWRNLEFAGRRIHRIQIPAAFQGGKIFVPEATLITGDESVVVRFLRDAPSGEARGSVTGTLDPAIIGPLLPPAAQPFFSSCQFSEGVTMDIRATLPTGDPKGLRLDGSIDIKNAHYKGVPLRRVAANVEMEGRKLGLRDIVLAKPEGEGTCAAMDYDLDTRLLDIRDAGGALHVQETAHLFGGNFEKYCKPYRFASPPRFDLDGLIDLGGGALSRFDLSVRGSDLLYPFLGVDVPARSVRAKVRFDGMRMRMASLDADVFGGGLGMSGGFDFTGREARFDLDFDVRAVAFDRVMRTFFQVEDVSGSLSGKVSLRGTVDRLGTLNGSGRADIRNGNILKIPVFGGLSALMSVFIPNLGYAKAENAGCDFVVEDGVVKWKDLALRSTTFAMICNGDYSIVRDNLDADARVNMRGPVGLMLFPVSKLFEYHGTGPLKNVSWGPKLLGK